MKSIDLNKVENSYGFTVRYNQSHFNKIKIQKVRIRISDSDSPQKIGMKMAWIPEPGQSVICIPYKLIIEIDGKAQKSNGFDAIAGQPAN
ncbi:NusG domain II-containing protein [Clostridium sp. JNZ X4-2]